MVVIINHHWTCPTQPAKMTPMRHVADTPQPGEGARDGDEGNS